MSGKQDQASHGDFQLLGLDHTASPQQVKKAYKSFVKDWHPDRFPQGSPKQQLAEARLKDINAAYRRIRSSWSADVFEQDPAKRSSEGPPFHDEPAGDVRPTAAVSYTSTFDLGPAFGRVWALLSLLVVKVRSRANKTSRSCMLTLLLLLLTAILIKADPFSLRNDQRDHPRTQHSEFSTLRMHPPSVLPTPLPSRAPDEPESLETLDQTQTMSPSEARDQSITKSESGPVIFSGSFFTIGSSQKEVLRIQGKPAKVFGQTWTYGLSDVTFKEGRVWRYHNFDGTLRVQMLPNIPVGRISNRKTFSLGSSRDEVLMVQGTPTQVEPNKWSYGFSEVYFKNDVVSGYNNFFSNLKVLMLPSEKSEAALSKGYFTIGSSQEDVLTVQGTPTIVHGNVWSYQLSEVQFLDGKVRIVNDFSGNLKFISPDLVAERQKADL